MPNYNGEKYIQKSIDSFLLQSYPSKQLIIVDGKSRDKSHELIKDYINNKEIVWIDESDNGISDAINIGIEYADGDIIGYLGSDDILAENILEKINYYFNIIDVDAISCNSITYYSEEGFYYRRYNPNIKFNKINLLKYGTITGLQNIFFRNNLLKDTKYDVTNKYSMDYEIYFRLVSKNIKVFYLDEIASINIFDNNISYKMQEIQRKEALDVALKNCSSLKEYAIVWKRKLKYKLNSLRRII